MSPTDLGEPRYLLLTTYRADGTPVPTPVWCVRDGSRLRVITQGDSGKVRRIRARADVEVGPCDARGRPRGPQAAARAVLLDEAEVEATADAIARRYGLLGRLLMRRSRRRRERGGTGIVAIAVEAAGAESASGGISADGRR